MEAIGCILCVCSPSERTRRLHRQESRPVLTEDEVEEEGDPMTLALQIIQLTYISSDKHKCPSKLFGKVQCTGANSLVFSLACTS